MRNGTKPWKHTIALIAAILTIGGAASALVPLTTNTIAMPEATDMGKCLPGVQARNCLDNVGEAPTWHYMDGGTVNLATGGGGGGGIGGSIAATQIAFGSGANTIAGDSNFTLTTSGSDYTVTLNAATVFDDLPGAGRAELTTARGQLRIDASGFVLFGANTSSVWSLIAAELGFPSFPYATIYVGASGAPPTCDSTTRGGFRNVFAAGGSSDTLQACMKTAADTYAWQTVFTAP